MGPRRTCIGCRRVAGTEELVRVARAADGSLVIGRSVPGRGAWLCRGRPECVEQAARRRAFERALRGAVGPAQVEQLRIDLQSGPSGVGGSEDRVV